MNKLWLIIKKLKVIDNQSNAFYLVGGEKLKLGRVVIKIIEANSEVPPNSHETNSVHDRSDSNNTEMSLGEIQDL